MKNHLWKWRLPFCVLWRPSHLMSAWGITHLASVLKLSLSLMQLDLAFLEKEMKSHLNSYREKKITWFLKVENMKKMRMDSKAIYRMNWFYEGVSELRSLGEREKGAEWKWGLTHVPVRPKWYGKRVRPGAGDGSQLAGAECSFFGSFYPVLNKWLYLAL